MSYFITILLDQYNLIRRNVASQDVISETEQRVAANSKEGKLLDKIYHYYDGNKQKFESLAMEVARIVISEDGAGANCYPGWITKKSGDHGIDFVMRIDVGKERLAGIKIIVLGQAKCTSPNSPTNGMDIGRTVARLKRGWIGVFVTLSYFTKSVQVEVNEDHYPIVLINGKKVANVVQEELVKYGTSLREYLDSLDKKYKIENHIPEDILRE